MTLNEYVKILNSRLNVRGKATRRHWKIYYLLNFIVEMIHEKKYYP